MLCATVRIEQINKVLSCAHLILQQNECPFACSPKKSFGDADLIEHVQLTFEDCSQCNLGAGESGDHSHQENYFWPWLL